MYADQIPGGPALRIAVLGASGHTGRQLTTQALARGHDVVAVARTPERLALSPDPHLRIAAAEVHDRDAMRRALDGVEAVVSGLGTSRRQPDTLTSGARAVIDANVGRSVWLGGYGTNESAPFASLLWRSIVQITLRSELNDKRDAERYVRDAGGTVVHAAPLTTGAGRGAEGVRLSEAPRQLIPARISRADVASVMLDQAAAAVPLLGTVVAVTVE